MAKTRTFTDAELQHIFSWARQAGLDAVKDTKPRAMVVGTPKDLTSDEFDPNKPMYYVADGPCGFAWIVIKPANCKAAKYAVKHFDAKPHWEGGVSIWVGEFRQSLALKEAYAHAFAAKLQTAGIKAYAGSRMD